MKLIKKFLPLLRRGFFWQDPNKTCETRTVKEYTILEKIHSTNQIYYVQTLEGPRYFRIYEDTVSSLASLCRTLGTEALGRLLEIDHLHSKSEAAELPGLGRGVLQAPASGFNIMPLPRSKRLTMLTPAFQRAMNDLNLLDTLCYEIDHSPNNYNVTADGNGSLTGLSVFDNNGKGTFACRAEVCFSTYKKLSPFVTKDGYIDRPHMCLQTAASLDRVSFHRLYTRMHPYLKALPILFLYIRLVRTRRAIHRTAKANTAFLLDRDAWSDLTIEEELSGRYGKTYLCGFLQDCAPPEPEPQPSDDGMTCLSGSKAAPSCR